MTVQSEYRHLRELVRLGQVQMMQEEIVTETDDVPSLGMDGSPFHLPRHQTTVNRSYSNGARVQFRLESGRSLVPVSRSGSMEAEPYDPGQPNGRWIYPISYEVSYRGTHMMPPSPANEGNRRLLNAPSGRYTGPGGLSYEVVATQQRRDPQGQDYLIDPDTGETIPRQAPHPVYEVPPTFAITRAIRDAIIEVMLAHQLPIISINRQLVPNHCARSTANPELFVYDCGELAGEILSAVSNAKSRADDMGDRVPPPEEPRTAMTRTTRRMLLDTE